MIDIHAHILPGKDDGPSSLSESLEMARIAVDDGISTIVATPHCLNGVYFNWRKDILSACAEFNLALEKNQIPLKVLPGSEARLGMEIMYGLENGRLMTINDSGKYFSLELPEQFIPKTVIAFINRLKDSGFTPIISHPERNPVIQRDVDLLQDLISAGSLSQITADSLMGGFGRSALNCCRGIIGKSLVHLMASDAHSPGARPPRLSKAVKKLSSLAGGETAERIIFKMPQMILDGEG